MIKAPDLKSFFLRHARSAKRRLFASRQFARDFQLYTAMARRVKVPDPKWEDRYPCLTDATALTEFDGHYVYHLAWAARILSETKPTHHIDIASSLHFCSLVSAFMPVTFLDFRPAPLTLDNLKCEAGDLNALPFADQSVDSISCMHVVEHIGLGRYGDPLDPLGDVKAMQELQRVVAPGGTLLFVTPVGGSKVCFNAHRIYNPQTIVETFSDLTLREFSLVPDDYMNDGFWRNATFEQALAQDYGCGCFWFVRE